jgi:hypothetical protein
MTEADAVPEGVDPAVPSPARLYDYYLGGTANFEADRKMAEQVRQLVPEIVDAAWANRGFHGRAAVWMARQGIRQFIDLGSGLPTQNNTHQAVSGAAPDARVAYVDNDPMVAAYSAALLAPGGRTKVITADIRDPAGVLGHPDVRRLIDLSEPTGVLMTAVVHFIADDADPWELVARYMAATVPGSYLALSHSTSDNIPPRAVSGGLGLYSAAAAGVTLRSRADVARFFAGLELVPPHPGAEPDLTYTGLWGAEDLSAADSDGSRATYCGVARRP